MAELTRLSQTLLHESRNGLVWIVAEDSRRCSGVVASVLNASKDLESVHIASPMPKMYEADYYKPRGVSSRNAALDWISAHADDDRSLVYFGDDDNTYDLRLFQEIRKTKVVSMFPVGLIGKQGVSGPIVEGGKIVGFTDDWYAGRKFPVDMAGFAFTVGLLRRHPAARMPYKAGHEEDLFLRNLGISVSDVEVAANNCTEVFVWHTQTQKSTAPKVKPITSRRSKNGDNLSALLRHLSESGVVDLSPSGRDLPTCFGHACEKTPKQ